MATQPQRRSPRWAQGRQQATILAPGEFLTPLSVMTHQGHWVNVGYALISPYHTSSWLSERTANMLDYHQQELAEEETHTFLTPLGNVTSTRAVLLWFELPQLPLLPSLMRLPLLGRSTVGDFEVDMILGIPFINWPPRSQRDGPTYVAPSITNAELEPIWPGYEEEELFQEQGDHRMIANQNMDMNNHGQ